MIWMVFVFICVYMALERLSGAECEESRGEVRPGPEKSPGRACGGKLEEERVLGRHEKVKNRLRLINGFTVHKSGVQKPGTVKIMLSQVEQIRVKSGTSGINMKPLRAAFDTCGSKTAPKKEKQKQQERFKYVTTGVILTPEVQILHLF